MVVSLILASPSGAMMPEKQTCQIVGSGSEENIWKIDSSHEQRVDICKDIITHLKNDYKGRDDSKGNSFCAIYTEALNNLYMLTERSEESHLDSLDIFMANLTTNLSHTGELLKFDSIPLEVYKLRKAFIDKKNFSKAIIKILGLINCSALNNKVFLVFDRYSSEGYSRVNAP